jgi:hypothetical protein
MVARDSILMDRYDARNLLDRIEVRKTGSSIFIFFVIAETLNCLGR